MTGYVEQLFVSNSRRVNGVSAWMQEELTHGRVPTDAPVLIPDSVSNCGVQKGKFSEACGVRNISFGVWPEIFMSSDQTQVVVRWKLRATQTAIFSTDCSLN